MFFEQWAGHRLLSEKVTRPHVRALRSMSISSVPVSEGIEIRQGCRFISGPVRALGNFPGRNGRFFTLFRWWAYVQGVALGVGTVFTRVNFHAVGDLSPSMPQGSLWLFGMSSWCSHGAFGWVAEAPLLHHTSVHTFSPWSIPNSGTLSLQSLASRRPASSSVAWSSLCWKILSACSGRAPGASLSTNESFLALPRRPWD